MTNGEKIKEIFPYLTKQMLSDNINIFEWWSAEYKKPTVKNDLGVDCISRADAIRVASGYYHPSNVANELAMLPSVIPQEPQSEWQYDHEILKAYSDGANEVLDKIRAEIEQEYKNEFGPYGQGLRRAIEIIDKYKAESAHDVAQEIVKNNGIVDI